jgi:nicotinamidase-related amidase
MRTWNQLPDNHFPTRIGLIEVARKASPKWSGGTHRRSARDFPVRLDVHPDHYGDFAATRDAIVRQALEGARPELVKPIVPAAQWPFYRRLRQTAFYATSLDSLLNRAETNRIILTGQVTEQCILYTALDAYVRHFDLVIARDAVAYIDDRLGSAALRIIERNTGGTLLSAAQCLPHRDACFRRSLRAADVSTMPRIRWRLTGVPNRQLATVTSMGICIGPIAPSRRLLADRRIQAITGTDGA